MSKIITLAVVLVIAAISLLYFLIIIPRFFGGLLGGYLLYGLALIIIVLYYIVRQSKEGREFRISRREVSLGMIVLWLIFLIISFIIYIITH
ncbi:MAG: hypothetical protein DRN17_04195 [Thermoplasmata archaeon]|nr:MAG: hypothetical protein DRN17_04195 [Thermoplasmata archaeon]